MSESVEESIIDNDLYRYKMKMLEHMDWTPIYESLNKKGLVLFWRAVS
jgi:hypothetical protein